MSILVIVESPPKAIPIKSYLGSNYKVIASVGHIRDLPKSTLGVDIENGFEPRYINISGKGEIIKQLKKEAKAATKVLLATDPDREGEAISWHLANVLGIPLDTKCRVTFNEVTKKAVKEGIKSPRTINQELVNSQQARRILDRIVGYKLSPFLWKNVKGGLSAGRVQSVATRLICDREEEIRAFVPQEYWTVDAHIPYEGCDLVAHYYGDVNGKKKLENEEQAQTVVKALDEGKLKVVSFKRSQKSKQPSPPFTTSTLQQEASKKLGFQSSRVMKVAQELYEGINLGTEFGGMQGLITYMRTDSLRISSDAQSAALSLISQKYGEAFAPKTPRTFRSKANAQDAHEAIRPADVKLIPDDIRARLSADQYKLYKLIWERFIASQMAAAIYETVALDLASGNDIFKLSGYNVKFRGYLAVGDDTNAEPIESDDVRMNCLPEMSEGDTLKLDRVQSDRHFTEPPPRYNDASIIKLFEETGIGRPSTYATIITTILNRRYVKREGKSLVPTPLGEVTTKLMKESFPDIVDVKFTADMENDLDNIENGTTESKQVLGEFYDKFDRTLKKAEENADGTQVKLPAEESEYECEKCGVKMIYKTGRFGRFLACPNYPNCKNTIAVDKNGVPVKKEEVKPEPAGFKCELCGAEMLIRHGRYGTFYACSNYPKCRFTKQKVNEIGVPCPECGAKIITKFSKSRKMFYSCERYPDCDFSTWDIPMKEKCPQCGDMLLYKKSKKLVSCRSKECGYQREEEIVAD